MQLVQGTLRSDLLGHQRRISSVALSPDGRLSLSGSLDRTVRLWDVPSGVAVRAVVAGTYDRHVLVWEMRWK